MKSTRLATILLMLVSSSVFAESVLRVHCAGDAEGARVLVNGEFRGNCPADLFLPPGETTLRVVKAVDDDRERVYETAFSLADQSAKRVNVELSGAQLTAEASQKRERARQKREREAAQLAMEKADNGDTEAMRELAGYYRAGSGVPEDAEKAEGWATRADELDSQRIAERTLERAQSGNIQAMQRMADRYENGDGVPQDVDKARQWRQRADQAIAAKTREKADDGDVAAMRTMATFYGLGKGVEQNAQKAEEWETRAENVIAEREKRKKEREQLAAERERNRKLQTAIDNTDYFENVQSMMSGYFQSMEDDGPIAFTFGIPSSPLPSAAGLLSDASAAPTKSTDVAIWKNRMTSRPSEFANPDSMIANAYANQPPSAD